jgi:Secretion system C-terminal sorting domain
MNNLKTILLCMALIMLATVSVNAQTSVPCPNAYFPYDFEYVFSSGPDAGTSAEGINDARSISEVENFFGSSVVGYVEKWDGSTPIVIDYMTPNMSDWSSIWSNCVKQAALDACIANDLAEWTNICPGMFTLMKVSGIPADTNGITMQWDNEPGDFKSGKDQNGNVTIAGGVTTTPYGTIDPTTLALRDPQINVNNSSSFNSQFVFTTCPPQCTIIPPQSPVSICFVMLHEIGHAFGLQDLSTDPGYPGGQPGTGTGASYPQSVMWGEINASQTTCPDATTSDDADQCYFCKLYCPGNCETLGAPLPPDDISMKISVFPNPATSTFTVMYKSAEPYSSLVIEDITGRKISSEKLMGSEGSLTISRDKLPSGAYIVKLQGSEHFVVRLLIIQ